ncbi:sodium- and chloride-dependent glycine transporter 2-like [Haemaphysalis longicornis]
MSEDRARWERKAELLLCCLGVTMGVGNLWRLPKVIYEGGGGSFLLPFLLSTVLLAKPLLCLEMCLGQFAGAGLLSVFQCCPASRGLGASMCLQAALTALLGNVVLAYTLLYLWHSVDVPWAHCDAQWGARLDTCFTTSEAAVSAMSTLAPPSLCRPCKRVRAELPFLALSRGGAHVEMPPVSSFIRLRGAAVVVSPKLLKILGLSGGLTEVQGIKTDVLVSLFIVWTHVFAFTRHSISAYRKLVYVTVLTPYAILLVILAQSLSLHGAMEGLRYMFVPDWARLSDYEVAMNFLWAKAASQALMSLTLGHGAFLVLSSFSDFSNRTPRDVSLVAFIDVATCLVACATVHALIGHLASLLAVPIDMALPRSALIGVAFVAVPEALVHLPVPAVWSFAFFLAVYLLGITASVVLTEVVLSSLSDQFNSLSERRALCSMVFCVTCFVIALPICTHAGPYLFYLLEWFISPTNTILICTLELVVINCGYGVKQLTFDLTFMLKRPLSKFWVICWKYIVWPVLLVLCVQRLVVVPLEGLRLFRYTYPWPAIACTHLLLVLVFLPVLVWALELIHTLGFAGALSPNPHWGPAEPENFNAYQAALGRSRHPSVNVEGRLGFPPEAPLRIVGQPDSERLRREEAAELEKALTASAAVDRAPSGS